MEAAKLTPRSRDFTTRLTSAIAAGACTAVAFAFFLPWIVPNRPGSAQLHRYSPLVDGTSTFTVEFGADGAPRLWSSNNHRLVPPAVALTSDLRVAHREALAKFLDSGVPRPSNDYSPLDQLEGYGSVFLIQSRSRRTTGTAKDEVTCRLRTSGGDYLIGIYQPSDDLDIVFDPPLRELSGALAVGDRWQQQGQCFVNSRSSKYEYDVHVVGRQTHENETGSYEDCIKVDAHLALLHDGDTKTHNRTSYYYAAEIGLVEWQSIDAEGKLKARSITLNAAGLGNRLLMPSPPDTHRNEPLSQPEQTATAESLELTRFAAVQSGSGSSAATCAPCWIPGERPLLLAANQAGDLTAFESNDGVPNVAWRFHVPGTVLGAPCFDVERSQIYFGATDKRLYALDADGLFRWSFLAQDNVPSQPTVIGKLVVFGSEDGCVYAVDTATGLLRWKYRAGGAISSTVSATTGIVAVGSDDGNIYALDPDNGQMKWTYEVGAPIVAPLIASDKQIIATAHNGRLYAVDAISGRELWQTYADVDLKAAPVISKERIFVTGSGCLTILDRKTGKRLARTTDQRFLGSPTINKETLLVVSPDRIQRLDFEGKSLESWAMPEPVGEQQRRAGLRFGATEGGDAFWLADDSGATWRLGPKVNVSVVLRPAWINPIFQEPFTHNYLNLTPAPFGEQLIALSSAREMFMIHPATGKATKFGAFGDAGVPAVEPMVANDTLLSAVGSTLYAIKLPEGNVLWKFDGGGIPLRPPGLGGDLAFWLVLREPTGEDANPRGGSERVLYAVDLQSGEVRWQKVLGAASGVGGCVTTENLVVLSTPPVALDAASGAVQWTANIQGDALGGPGIDSSHQTLFVGASDPQTDAGSVAAIRIADGKVQWQRPLETSTLHPAERPWVDEQLLIIPLWSGEIDAIDVVSGQRRWRYKPPVARLGAITVSSGRVWYMQRNGQVIGLATSSGRPAEHMNLDVDLSSYTSFARPVVINGRVVAPLTLMILGLELPKGRTSHD